MKNILCKEYMLIKIIQNILKIELNWHNYAKKHKFNLIQINSVDNLNYKKVDGIIFSGGNDLSKIKK